MQKKIDRPVQFARRRLPLFPGSRQRRTFFSIASPFRAEKTFVVMPGNNQIEVNNALQTLAAATDHIRHELERLQQLRETVAEAERSYLDRQRRLRARPLS
jgi:hypothetical protein